MTELLTSPLDTEQTTPDFHQLLPDELIHAAQAQADAIERGESTDRKAIDAVFINTWPLVERVAHRYGRDYETAEDIASEALEKVIRNGIFKRQYGVGNFPAYAARVVLNLTIDTYRRQKKYTQESLENEYISRKAEIQYALPAPDEGYNEQESLERINSVLAETGMPKSFKDALLLFSLGMSQEEIAEATHTPKGTAQSRLGRGYKKVRDHCGITKGTTHTYDLFAEAAPVPLRHTDT